MVTNPPALPFFVRTACALRKAKCILLVHDVYPDLMIAVGKLRPCNIIARLLSISSQILLRSMEHIIVLGRDMKELIESKLDSNRNIVTIITNWADIDMIRPMKKNENSLLLEHNLIGKFVVLYAGNMGYPHDIKTIIQAAEKLKARNDIQFIFLGSGVKKKWLEQYVLNRNLKNVLIISSLPRELQSVFLNCCDIGLVSLIQGMKGISVPSRLYNLLASGKTILAIADPGSEASLVINEQRLGWVVTSGQSDQLVDIITYAQQNPEILSDMGARARRVAEEKYSFERVIINYRHMLEGIIGICK